MHSYTKLGVYLLHFQQVIGVVDKCMGIGYRPKAKSMACYTGNSNDGRFLFITPPTHSSTTTRHLAIQGKGFLGIQL